jgi:hypothetical protein
VLQRGRERERRGMNGEKNNNNKKKQDTSYVMQKYPLEGVLYEGTAYSTCEHIKKLREENGRTCG